MPQTKMANQPALGSQATAFGAGLLIAAAFQGRQENESIELRRSWSSIEHANLPNRLSTSQDLGLDALDQINESLEAIKAAYQQIAANTSELNGTLRPVVFGRQFDKMEKQLNQLRLQLLVTPGSAALQDINALAQRSRAFLENLSTYQELPTMYLERFDQLELEMERFPERTEIHEHAAAFLSAAESAYASGMPAEVRAAMDEVDRHLSAFRDSPFAVGAKKR